MLKERDVIAGRYRLDSPIGEGAMGAVWRAEDQTLKRQVAIKFLFVRGARDPQAMVDQFLREARIAASVQHRNVIHTVDFGTVDDFQPFMVMELLNGESLGDRMAREPRLSSEQFIHIISLTLRGLSAVHDAGIVHRDLKPQNVFLQRDSDAVYPKILDFGISRSLNGGLERASAIATQEGMIVGTPDYMSPEQARGERNIDRRADIYSMGAILFEGLTGRLPFIADTVGDLIVQIVTTQAPRVTDIVQSVPKPLSDLVAQAMSRNREHRFADARALRRALLAAAEAAWSRGGRIAASGPPGPIHVGDGAGLLSLPPAAPVPSFVAAGGTPPAAPGAADAKGAKAKSPAAEGAAWGDFVGLESPRIRDDNPPPSSSTPSFLPPKQQRLVAHANDPLLDLPSDSAPAPLFLDEGAGPAPGPPARARTSVPRKPGERATTPDVPPAGPPGAASARGSKPRARAEPAIPRDDFADMMNPLYAGQDRAAPEIDHDRMKVASPPRKTRGDRTIAAAARVQAAPKAERRIVLLRPAMGGWLLPIAALIGVAYLLYEPELPATPTAEQISNTLAGEIPAGAAEGTPAGASGVAHGRSRREHPGEAPAHMRDVLF